MIEASLEEIHHRGHVSTFEFCETIRRVKVMRDPTRPTIHAFEHLLNNRHLHSGFLVILGKFIVQRIIQPFGITQDRNLRINDICSLRPEYSGRRDQRPKVLGSLEQYIKVTVHSRIEDTSNPISISTRIGKSICLHQLW